VVAAAAVGGLIGYAAGRPAETAPPGPVELSSAVPTLPVDPPPSYAPDLYDGPVLTTDLQYVWERVRDGEHVWKYEVPKGWHRTRSGTVGREATEFYWRPHAVTIPGGYMLRVWAHTTAFDVSTTEEAKIGDLQKTQDDVVVEDSPANSVYFDYKDRESDQHRANYFAWITPPSGYPVEFEMSVAGRMRDAPGLAALIQHVQASVTRVR
jgi:hypothetical protein